MKELNKEESSLEQSLSKMDENMEWDPKRKQKIEGLIRMELHKPIHSLKNNRFKTQRLLLNVSFVVVITIFALMFSSLDLKTGSEHNRTGSIFQLIGDKDLKEVAEKGKVRDISLKSDNGLFKITVEEEFYDNNKLAISYKVETESHELEELIHNQLIELHIDGELVRNPIIRPYQLNPSGTVLEGIIKVEGTKELPDAISVNLSFSRFAEGSNFMFDMQKQNVRERVDSSYEEIRKRFFETYQEVELSSIFSIPVTFGDGKKGEYVFVGEKGKLAVQIAAGVEGETIQLSPIRPNQPDKYMWYLWGENLTRKSFKVIGANIDTKQEVVIVEGIVLGPGMNGADAHTPSTMEFPNAGVWKLVAYVDEEIFGHIIIEVQK
jgi:hypothetical protein